MSAQQLAMFLIALAIVAIAAAAYVAIVATPRRSFNTRSSDWQVKVDACIWELGTRQLPHLDLHTPYLLLNEYARCVLSLETPLDAALKLISEGNRLRTESRWSELGLPQWLKRKFPTLADPALQYVRLEEKLNDLTAARTRALLPIDQALRDYLPDLRERLGALPLQASSLAVGVATLVGFVWLAGYYGMLGVAFIPLLSDIDDIALIGFTSGIVPLAAFVSMVAASLVQIETARSAVRSHESARAIARALITARDVRRMWFWSARTIMCLMLLVLISAAAAATLKLRPQYTLSFSNGSEVANAALVGSIGDFVLISEGAGKIADRRIIAVPHEQFRCIGSRSKDRTSKDRTSKDPCVDEDKERVALPMPTHVTVINEDTVRHNWQAYVAREAECWVINPDDPAPLLSPVFRDNKGTEFDTTYNGLHSTSWPGSDVCSSEKSECAAKVFAGQVVQLIARLRADDARNPSLHLFAFASDTHFPQHNRNLAEIRAHRILELLKEHAPELKGCEISPDHERPGRPRSGCPVSVHAHAIGQMPDVLWAGVQGDASRRVVMAAACEANVR